jgi:hypothetical protein
VRRIKRPINRITTPMDASKPSQPDVQDTTQTERRLAALGMSAEAAKAYAAFHAGLRWPRPSDF